MDRIGNWLEIIPPSMREPVLFAVPFFLLLLTIEWTAARKLEHLEDRPTSGAYMARDAWASISMGLVSVATMGAWKFLALLGYAALYAYVAPWHLSATKWYTWVIALVGVDVLFYFYHRTAHRVRLIWATHQAHHSSRYFNFATALRQKWNNSGEIVVWTPLPLLGIPPWMVFSGFSVSLIYQFWIHTEAIRSIGWLENVLNTPSHHRVHHGSNRRYLDRNHGSILIIWDRIFGTFQREDERVVYGLTRNINSFNPARIATHEWQDMARDIERARTWRDRFGFLVRGPGWAYTRRAELEGNVASGSAVSSGADGVEVDPALAEHRGGRA